MTIRNVRITLISLIALLATVILPVIVHPKGVLSAECFDSYGRPIECPINLGVEKQVRRGSGTSYADSLTGVLDGQSLVYRLIVTNKGTEKVENLDVRDFIIDPAERDNIQFGSSTDLAKVGNDLTAKIDLLLPGQSKELLYAVSASDSNIAEGGSLVVENQVNLILGDEVAATDVASVTVKRGEVLAAEVLPDTGPADAIVVSLYLGYLGFLVRRIKLYRYL